MKPSIPGRSKVTRRRHAARLCGRVRDARAAVPATVNRLLNSPHAEGAGPARRIVGRGHGSHRRLRGGNDPLRGRSARRRHKSPRADVRGAGGADADLRDQPPRPARRPGIRRVQHDPLSVVRAGPAPRIQMERAGTRSGRADGRPDPLVRRRAGPRRVPRRLRGTHERQQRGLAGRRPHLSAQRRRRRTRARVAHGMDVRGLAGRVAGRAECGSAHTVSDAS